MQKEVSTFSTDEMEDAAFIAALREAENSGKGNLSKLKAHLENVSKGK